MLTLLEILRRPYLRCDIEWLRPGPERADLRGRQVEPEGRETTRLREETPGGDVVDLVVPRRLVDERRLIAVAGVKVHRRGAAVETEVPVETVGELREPLRDVGVEPARQHSVRHDAERREQQAEHDQRRNEPQPAAEPHAAAESLADSRAAEQSGARAGRQSESESGAASESGIEPDGRSVNLDHRNTSGASGTGGSQPATSANALVITIGRLPASGGVDRSNSAVPAGS